MISVILSGGVGMRLWPASRESHPKPFIKLADGETLIHKTYARAKKLGSEVLTVTNRDYYFMSLDEQKRSGVSGNFLLEPCSRNTAPAIAMAAKYVAAVHGFDTIILVMAADHLIADEVSFSHAIENSVKIAKEGFIVTFGVAPSFPETGFGYIECGESLGGGYRVACFVEKPNLETAKNYVDSGNYLWNSGMFCFQAGAFLEELNKMSPLLAQAVDDCWEAMHPLDNSNLAEIPADLFERIPDISVDNAVMEKSEKIAVVPGNFGWNDIGSWNVVRDLVVPDASQNRASGEAIFVGARNVFVQSENRLVAAVGVSDLIIVDTPDALLVVHPDNTQDVKKVVTQLKSRNHDTFKLHRTVSRPWGHYTVLEEAPGFKIKRIEVKPGASLSLQMHQHRSEHWVVVSGVARITNGNAVTLVKHNESTYIPAGQKHRLENPGDTPCVMIEVQSGLYLGEDDIVRFDDKYGR